MPKKLKQLFVAAYSNELKPLCALGSSYLKIKGDVAHLAAGIGPVAAAFGLTHFLEDYRPEAIISLGTAGTFKPNQYQVGDVVYAKSVSLMSYQDLVYPVDVKRSQLILPKFKRQYSKSLRHCNRVSVYCPQEITKSDELAMNLSEHHDVESLETFAFAFVAAKFKIPIVSILGITNVVGSNGHAQWKKNEPSVVEKISEVVKMIL